MPVKQLEQMALRHARDAGEDIVEPDQRATLIASASNRRQMSIIPGYAQL